MERGTEGRGKEKVVEEREGEKDDEGQDHTHREGTGEHNS